MICAPRRILSLGQSPKARGRWPQGRDWRLPWEGWIHGHGRVRRLRADDAVPQRAQLRRLRRAPVRRLRQGKPGLLRPVPRWRMAITVWHRSGAWPRRNHRSRWPGPPGKQMLNLAQAIDKRPDLRYNNAVVDETFLGSSMAEHSAVNRRVVGSSPYLGRHLRTLNFDTKLTFLFACFDPGILQICPFSSPISLLFLQHSPTQAPNRRFSAPRFTS